ncbi:MAG: hypothetical protein H8E66_07700 [Planctomycetes bacterium]|nr:hypothetical protein [Planctomycetota bacterium]
MTETPDAQHEVRGTLSTLRIIVISLVMGVSIFLGYALATASGDAEKEPMLWTIMAGFAGMALLARAVVPGFVFSTIRRKISQGNWQPTSKNRGPVPKTDEGLLMAALQMKTILGCAILEAPGFANGYAYMTERQPASFAIALALILLIAAHFPLRFWLDGWLQRQIKWIEEDRQLRPASGNNT